MPSPRAASPFSALRRAKNASGQNPSLQSHPQCATIRGESIHLPLMATLKPTGAPTGPKRTLINSGVVPKNKPKLLGAGGGAIAKAAPARLNNAKGEPRAEDIAADKAKAEARAAEAAARKAAEEEAAKAAAEEAARQAEAERLAQEQYERELEEYNRQMAEYERQLAEQKAAEEAARKAAEEEAARLAAEEAARKAAEEEAARLAAEEAARKAAEEEAARKAAEEAARKAAEEEAARKAAEEEAARKAAPAPGVQMPMGMPGMPNMANLPQDQANAMMQMQQMMMAQQMMFQQMMAQQMAQNGGQMPSGMPMGMPGQAAAPQQQAPQPAQHKAPAAAVPPTRAAAKPPLAKASTGKPALGASVFGKKQAEEPADKGTPVPGAKPGLSKPSVGKPALGTSVFGKKSPTPGAQEPAATKPAPVPGKQGAAALSAGKPAPSAGKHALGAAKPTLGAAKPTLGAAKPAAPAEEASAAPAAAKPTLGKPALGKPTLGKAPAAKPGLGKAPVSKPGLGLPAAKKAPAPVPAPAPDEEGQELDPEATEELPEGEAAPELVKMSEEEYAMLTQQAVPFYKKKSTLIAVGIFVVFVIVVFSYVASVNAETRAKAKAAKEISDVINKAIPIMKANTKDVGGATTNRDAALANLKLSPAEMKILRGIMLHPDKKDENGQIILGSSYVGVAQNACYLMCCLADRDPKVADELFKLLNDNAGKMNKELFRFTVVQLSTFSNVADFEKRMLAMAKKIRKQPKSPEATEALADTWEILGARVNEEAVEEMFALLQDSETEPKVMSKLYVGFRNYMILPTGDAAKKKSVAERLFDVTPEKLRNNMSQAMAKGCSEKALAFYKGKLGSNPAEWNKNKDALKFLAEWGDDSVLDFIDEMQQKAGSDEKAQQSIRNLLGTLLCQRRERENASADKLIKVYLGDPHADTSQLQELIRKTDLDAEPRPDENSQEYKDAKAQRDKLEPLRDKKIALIKMMGGQLDFAWVNHVLDSYLNDPDKEVAISAKEAKAKLKKNQEEYDMQQAKHAARQK